MRIAKGLAVALAVLAVLAAGLALPRAALALQDGRLQGQVTRHAVEGVRFDAAAPLEMADKLRVLGGGYTAVPLEEGGALDAAGAHRAALEFLAWLGENGPRLAGGAVLVRQDETPFLAVGEAEAEAVLVWRCELASAEGDEIVNVLIDDETGTMLSFVYADLRGQSLEESTTAADQAGQKLAEAWGETLRRYYGYQAYTAVLQAANGAAAEYAMTFSGQEDGQVTLTCAIGAGTDKVLFNPQGSLGAE